MYRETQVLAIDCERILTEEGDKLARVSIVNFYGNIVFDTLVKPCRYHTDTINVIDYREWITGIKPIDLEHAPTFGNIEPIVRFYFFISSIFKLFYLQIQKIFKNKTIVGHSLHDDFKILNINTEALNVSVRDISNIDIFMKQVDSPTELYPIKNNSSGSKSSNGKLFGGMIIKKRKLKDLSQEFLNAKIQSVHHSSVIDARAALALYRMNYESIETEIRCSQALQELKDKKNTNDKLKHQDFQGQARAATQEVHSFENLKNPENKENFEAKAQKESIFSACGMQSIKDIQFLMENNSQIFNITPPNFKDEDKLKGNEKYSLFKENSQNKNWRGFTASKIICLESEESKMSQDHFLASKGKSKLNDLAGFKEFNQDPFLQPKSYRAAEFKKEIMFQE